MSTRHPSRNPEPSSTPPAAPFVPTQTSRSETGPTAERLAYSVNEAARLTGLSRDLLYDEMRRGNLDYIKVGRRRLITRQHLEQFLDITTPEPQPSVADSTVSGLKAAADAS